MKFIWCTCLFGVSLFFLRNSFCSFYVLSACWSCYSPLSISFFTARGETTGSLHSACMVSFCVLSSFEVVCPWIYSSFLFLTLYRWKGQMLRLPQPVCALRCAIFNSTVFTFDGIFSLELLCLFTFSFPVKKITPFWVACLPLASGRWPCVLFWRQFLSFETFLVLWFFLKKLVLHLFSQWRRRKGFMGFVHTVVHTTSL